jgi:hypothetical protein
MRRGQLSIEVAGVALRRRVRVPALRRSPGKCTAGPRGGVAAHLTQYPIAGACDRRQLRPSPKSPRGNTTSRNGASCRGPFVRGVDRCGGKPRLLRPVDATKRPWPLNSGALRRAACDAPPSLTRRRPGYSCGCMARSRACAEGGSRSSRTCPAGPVSRFGAWLVPPAGTSAEVQR